MAAQDPRYWTYERYEREKTQGAQGNCNDLTPRYALAQLMGRVFLLFFSRNFVLLLSKICTIPAQACLLQLIRGR